jgi:2-amino-4-hydroxy-6-hydroxymethyldihydropteridine diphosphokinase
MDLLLLLGGNVGDPLVTFAQAEADIEERIGPIRSRSRDHWTLPWGFSDHRLFLNRALLMHTKLDPRTVLERSLAIEADFGRVRSTSGYSSRTLDIDLLLAEELTMDEPDLVIPHPRLHQRAFALAPAADIAPLQQHPLLHRTILDLLNDVIQRP